MIGWYQDMNNQSRSGEHERRVQELRRSNAAGAHGNNAYSRREKYKTDWLEVAYDEYPECESDDLG